MNHWAVSVIAAGLVAMSFVQVQQSDQPPATASVELAKDTKAETALEDLIAQALKNNPDVRVAEAKLREAEAELNRAKLQTTQKLVVIHGALAAARSNVERFEAVVKQIVKGGVGNQSEGAAKFDLAQAKSKLADLEADVTYLTGRGTLKTASAAVSLGAEGLKYLQPQVIRDGASLDLKVEPVVDYAIRLDQKLHANPPATRPSNLDKIRKGLDAQIEVRFDSTPLKEVLKFVEDSAPGVSFRILENRDGEREVSLHLNQATSVGALLQALEDTFIEGASELRFVLRDYGILVTWSDKIPPGAPGVVELWKAIPDKKADTNTPKKPQ